MYSHQFFLSSLSERKAYGLIAYTVTEGGKDQQLFCPLFMVHVKGHTALKTLFILLPSTRDQPTTFQT